MYINKYIYKHMYTLLSRISPTNPTPPPLTDTMDSSHRAVLDTFIGTATVDGDPFQSISPLPYMISRLMGSFSGEHVPEITNRAQCLKANVRGNSVS